MMKGPLRKPIATISVSEPVLQQPGEKGTPYVTYLVAGSDSRGNFSIRRRFREFDELRKKLVERFVGVYVPPIPSKKAAGNTDERIVEERRAFFNYFCCKIAERAFLLESDIFQSFVRGQGDFEGTIRAITSNDLALIAGIYESEFSDAAQSAEVRADSAELEEEGEALRAIEKRLTEIREQIREIVELRKEYLTHYSKCCLGLLPRFEQNFLLRHHMPSESACYLDNQAFKDRLGEYMHFSVSGSPLLDYIELLSYDIREARALLEAVESRKALESKREGFEKVERERREELERLRSGRTSFRSFFTSGSKEEQIRELENYIPQYERSQALLRRCFILSAASIRRDIAAFRQSRTLHYLTSLQTIAQKELRVLSLYGEMLLTVSPESRSAPLPSPQIQFGQKNEMAKSSKQ